MARDFMNREYALLILDTNLKDICINIDYKMDMYEILTGIGDEQSAKSYRILVSALKRSATYIISRAEDLGMIDYDDWLVMNRAINNIGLDPEDRL